MLSAVPSPPHPTLERWLEGWTGGVGGNTAEALESPTRANMNRSSRRVAFFNTKQGGMLDLFFFVFFQQ